MVMAGSKEDHTSYDAPPSDTESFVSESPSIFAKSFSDPADYDRDILDEEEERNDLPMRHRTGGSHSPSRKTWSREKSRQPLGVFYKDAALDLEKNGARYRNKKSGQERRGLLHSMEEGGDRSRTPSSDASSDVYMEKTGQEMRRKKVCLT